MPKKILANLFLLLAINLLIKPFWILGIDRTVQNTVGNQAYGQYMVLFNLSVMLTMLLDFGINNYTSTFIAKHPQMLKKKFATLFPLKLVFSAAYLVATFLLGLMYGMRGTPLMLLVLLSFNQVLTFFVLFFRSNISGLQWFRTDALLSVTDRGMMILFAGSLLLLAQGTFTITHFIMAQTVGYFVSFIISFVILLKPLQGLSIRFNKLMMISFVRKSLPYALLALLMTVYMRADVLIMKKLLANGDEQNGIYGVANRLLEAANMLAALVATMLLPLFANMIKAKQNLENIVKMAIILLVIPAVAVSAMAWFYNTDIMLLLSKTSPLQSAPVFKVVMISFVAMCVMYIFGTLLTANGNLSILNKLAAIALLINIVLNLWLQPKLGAQGAAIAITFTHGFIALTNMYFAVRYLKLSIDFSFFIKVIITLLLTVLAAGICVSMKLPLAIATAIVMLAVILMLFVTRLLKINQLKQLLPSKA
jgi:O-antigen/teichoic acid export membrane protein